MGYWTSFYLIGRVNLDECEDNAILERLKTIMGRELVSANCFPDMDITIFTLKTYGLTEDALERYRQDEVFRNTQLFVLGEDDERVTAYPWDKNEQPCCHAARDEAAVISRSAEFRAGSAESKYDKLQMKFAQELTKKLSENSAAWIRVFKNTPQEEPSGKT